MRKIGVLIAICFVFLISVSQVGFVSARKWVRHSVGAEEAPEIEWVRQFGTSESDRPGRIAVNFWGNAYVTGTLGDNAFIAKYDCSGYQEWITQVEVSEYSGGMGIAVDFWGNTYVTGISVSGDDENADAFIAKYNRSGNQVWIKQFDVSEITLGMGIAVDRWGRNIYVTGVTGSEEEKVMDAFIAKYDRYGNQVWIDNLLGGSGFSFGMGIAVDFWGNAYMTGALGGDAFITKYDQSGNQVWIEQFGTSKDDDGTGIALDFRGNIYVAGSTMGTFTDQDQVSEGGFDAYVAKYDCYGDQVWVKQFGTSGDDGNYDAVDVAVDFWGNIYVSGNTDGAFLDQGQTNEGKDDLFIAKLR